MSSLGAFPGRTSLGQYDRSQLGARGERFRCAECEYISGESSITVDITAPVDNSDSAFCECINNSDYTFSGLTIPPAHTFNRTAVCQWRTLTDQDDVSINALRSEDCGFGGPHYLHLQVSFDRISGEDRIRIDFSWLNEGGTLRNRVNAEKTPLDTELPCCSGNENDIPVISFTGLCAKLTDLWDITWVVNDPLCDEAP